MCLISWDKSDSILWLFINHQLHVVTRHIASVVIVWRHCSALFWHQITLSINGLHFMSFWNQRNIKVLQTADHCDTVHNYNQTMAYRKWRPCWIPLNVTLCSNNIKTNQFIWFYIQNNKTSMRQKSNQVHLGFYIQRCAQVHPVGAGWWHYCWEILAYSDDIT